jgi:predicted protein tyrosine phosphatase
MKIIHVSRHDIETAQPHHFDLECLIISITDPGSAPAAIPEHPKIKGLHRVEPFHDVDRKVTGTASTLRRAREMANAKAEFLSKPVPYELFDAVRAKALVDFVKAHVPVPLIIVHCEAGISRSAGVAAALQEHFDPLKP